MIIASSFSTNTANRNMRPNLGTKKRPQAFGSWIKPAQSEFFNFFDSFLTKLPESTAKKRILDSTKALNDEVLFGNQKIREAVMFFKRLGKIISNEPQKPLNEAIGDAFELPINERLYTGEKFEEAVLNIKEGVNNDNYGKFIYTLMNKVEEELPSESQVASVVKSLIDEAPVEVFKQSTKTPHSPPNAVKKRQDALAETYAVGIKMENYSLTPEEMAALEIKPTKRQKIRAARKQREKIQKQERKRAANSQMERLPQSKVQQSPEQKRAKFNLIVREAKNEAKSNYEDKLEDIQEQKMLQEMYGAKYDSDAAMSVKKLKKRESQRKTVIIKSEILSAELSRNKIVQNINQQLSQLKRQEQKLKRQKEKLAEEVEKSVETFIIEKKQKEIDLSQAEIAKTRAKISKLRRKYADSMQKAPNLMFLEKKIGQLRTLLFPQKNSAKFTKQIRVQKLFSEEDKVLMDGLKKELDSLNKENRRLYPYAYDSKGRKIDYDSQGFEQPQEAEFTIFTSYQSALKTYERKNNNLMQYRANAQKYSQNVEKIKNIEAQLNAIKPDDSIIEKENQRVAQAVERILQYQKKPVSNSDFVSLKALLARTLINLKKEKLKVAAQYKKLGKLDSIISALKQQGESSETALAASQSRIRVLGGQEAGIRRKIKKTAVDNIKRDLKREKAKSKF